jgi:hypothetical protein
VSNDTGKLLMQGFYGMRPTIEVNTPNDCITQKHQLLHSIHNMGRKMIKVALVQLAKHKDAEIRLYLLL